MPKQFASRVRFMEPVEVWGTKDAINRERFMEAFYWASGEFDPAGKLDFRVTVIHGDADAQKFMGVGPYPGTVFYPSADTKPMRYEVWFFGRVTDAMMIAGLANAFARDLKLDGKTSAALAQKAFKHLQSTISVKELERK